MIPLTVELKTGVCASEFLDSCESLYRLNNLPPIKTIVMIVKTSLNPVIDYRDVCYFQKNADLLNRLSLIINWI